MDVGLYMYVVVVQKFTFAISSPDEFLLFFAVDPMSLSSSYIQILEKCINRALFRI